MTGKRNHTGHRVGEWHQRATLSDEEVRRMRELRERHGLSYAALSQRFGCGQSTARDIVQYRTRAIA